MIREYEIMFLSNLSIGIYRDTKTFEKTSEYYIKIIFENL